MKPGKHDPMQHIQPAPAEVNALIALSNARRYTELENRARLLVGLYPNFGFGYKLLSVSLLMQGKDPLLALQKTVQLLPDDAGAHNNLGNALQDLGQFENAEASFRRAVKLRPDFAMAYNNLGNALRDLGQLKDAVTSYRHALQLKPDLAETHNNLGIILLTLGQPDDAVACYRFALDIEPDYAEANNNLGNALKELGQLDDAVTSCRRALEIEPYYSEAHNNLGIALTGLRQFDDAVASYHRALEIKPDFAEAHHNMSLVLLSRGEFHEGWREYEWRIQCQSGNAYIADPRNPSQVLPRPSTLLPIKLDGKRILFVPDQGIGDELFFLRFAKVAQQRGAWTAYLPSSKIATIVQRAPGLDMVISDVGNASNLDHIFSVGDLPLLLGVDRLEDIPPALPLSALPDRISAIRNRLAVLGRAPLLGVTWRAGTEKKAGVRAALFKETDISLLGSTLSAWPGEVLILQRNPRPDEIESFMRALGRPAHDFSDLNENLEDMLALLSQLDEYVGVSNTNMHLMAGLGKTARVLIPHPPEWRWMTGCNESPWFPGFQQYRENPNKDWNSALPRLTKDLLKGVWNTSNRAIIETDLRT